MDKNLFSGKGFEETRKIKNSLKIQKGENKQFNL